MNFIDRAISMSESRDIDHGALIGFGVSLLLISVVIVASGNGLNFINPAGLIIVLGGTFGATLVHFSPGELRQALQECKRVILTPMVHPVDRIGYLVSLAQTAKIEGLLILDREAQVTPDRFLRLGFELTVDGQPQSEIRRILENEMRTSHDRSARSVQVFETLGNYSPAMGLIGTLIGLIQMLGSLQNPSAVGPAMAIALVTTFYGALFANVLFLPLAGKLRTRADGESLVKSVTLDGVVSLGLRESSIVLEQRLQSFLPAPTEIS